MSEEKAWEWATIVEATLRLFVCDCDHEVCTCPRWDQEAEEVVRTLLPEMAHAVNLRIEELTGAMTDRMVARDVAYGMRQALAVIVGEVKVHG